MSLDPSDRGSRFLFSDRDFVSSKRKIHARALLPSIYESRLELSVADTEQMAESEVWAAGRIVEQSRTPMTLKARADFKKSYINDLELKFFRDDIGFMGHALIIDWPIEEARQQDLAGTLAVNSTLEIKQ